MACMLYVDQVDRSGNERAWVSIADSIGLTATARRGAHNGWRARGDQALVDVWGGPLDISHDPSIARYDHGGQPGTLWDMFGVRGGADLETMSGGHLGSRMGSQATVLAAGKDSKLGPTAAMLRTYYRILLFLTGDITSGIFAPFVNNGQDDDALLHDYMRNPAPGDLGTTRRAVLVEGSGFVQSEYATGSLSGNAAHLALLRDDLGVTIRTDGAGDPEYSYTAWSGNFTPSTTVTTTGSGPASGLAVTIDNPCTAGHDVLDIAPGSAGGLASAYYPNVGTNGPYIASVFTPRQPGTIYESLVDGWNIERISGVDGSSCSTGRGAYFWRLLTEVAAATGCAISEPCVALDVPGGKQQALVDFMRLTNNPLERGEAVVRFGLARADRVTARVYDLAGRQVRTLADRSFPAGEHELRWDGADDQGRPMARGVYFTRLRYAASGFDRTTKLIVLR
jgi:hypothetical protein